MRFCWKLVKIVDIFGCTVFPLLAKSWAYFSFVVCCLPVRIQFIRNHIGISSGRKLPQDFHGIIFDWIKLFHLWCRSQPESTRSCLQRSPSILPLSLEPSEQWDPHSLFGTVAALHWLGALLLLGRGCSTAPLVPADLLVVSWGLWPCTTACCFSCNIFFLIFSIWPTMTYKDRHKPGFELWGGWCWNTSKSHSRTCGLGSCLCILDRRKLFSSWFAEHLVTSKTWAIQLLSVLKGFISSFSNITEF